MAHESPQRDFSVLDVGSPKTPFMLELPAQSIILHPGDEAGLFSREYADTETLLGLHRFAWLNWMGATATPEWVAAIWRAWADKHSIPEEGWPWHPYTATERAINILTFSQQHGLPGPKEETLSVLSSHSQAIANNLEYFGEHHTSNHLANNGRGLYLLGLGLGMEVTADLGGQILIEEAKRIFYSPGVLREDSSHYHLLLTRNYEQVARAAKQHKRKEEPVLRAISNKARAVAEHMVLPGGLPLIGDISPDLPPKILLKQLALLNTVSNLTVQEKDALAGAGWLRHEIGPFSAIWHVAPDGWSHIPGHGHQDVGSFELHCDKEAVFVDPGRGSYGEKGTAALYRSAAVHNTLTINDADPYPANKPYYNNAFRRKICGKGPVVEHAKNNLTIIHNGYARISGVGQATRNWAFNENSVAISDTLDGRGKHCIKRKLVTPLRAERNGDIVLLYGDKNVYRLNCNSKSILSTITIWCAYGSSQPGTCIEFYDESRLPWVGSIRLERA